uniref:TIL domain-containing protein n=1 Tax=Syphacia muris TaxID=451379 RepID=A0A0N5AE40_9BILA
MLTPMPTFTSDIDPIKHLQTVIIPPGLQCINCSIRLIHRAKEFADDYSFYSCASVNIAEISESVFRTVIPVLAEVFAEIPPVIVIRSIQAKIAQFELNFVSGLDECWNDKDCSINGKCIAINEQSDPRKQCFCKKGRFGEQCERESTSNLSNEQFDPSLYKTITVGEDDDEIYWRIIENEIEFVLKFKGNSWTAVGWKGNLNDNKCLAINGYGKPTAKTNVFNLTNLEQSQVPETTTDTSVSVATIPPTKTHPLIHVEPIGNKKTLEKNTEKCGENEVFSNCPEFTRQCEASCEWTSFPETIPDCPRTCGTPKCVCKEGYVRLSNDNDTCVPFNYCSNETEVQCPGNATWAKCGLACEPTCENMYDTSPCEATCDVPACTCADNYVRYKGECIFWGDCPNLEEHWATEAVTKPATKEVTQDKQKELASGTSEVTKQPGIEELTCSINETINECGRICEPDCVTVFLREECTLCARPACACIEGYARHNGKCIYWGDCSLDVKSLRPSLDISKKMNITALTNSTILKNTLSKVVNGTWLESERIQADSDKIEKLIEESLSAALNGNQNVTSLLVEAIEKSDDGKANERNETVTDKSDKSNFNMSKVGIVRALAVKSAPYLADSKDTSPNNKLLHPTNTDEKDPGICADVSIVINNTILYIGVVGDVCYGDWRWPPGCHDCNYKVSWNYLDETDEVEFSVETRLPTNGWSGIGFSKTGSMAEADMIVVKSRNGRLSLHDMYATGSGLLREDKEQNVYTPTIIGTHTNGVLRAQFTRKRDTGDRVADHRFSDSDCYKFLFPVSGGKLDESGQIVQDDSEPRVSETEVCIRSCTSPQTLQPTTSCETEFRYPTGCEGSACDYVAKWEYSTSNKDVRFEISAKELGRWTGIGFSRDGNMANSDIYTGWVYEGKAYITDRFAYGRQLPAIDPADRQNIYNISGKIEDDIQTISFQRKIITSDTVTDFPLNKCYYFLFPIGGGRVLARRTHDFQSAKTPIGYHDLYQPRVSRSKICICDKNGVPVASEDAPPAVRQRRQVHDPFDIQSDLFSEVPPTVQPGLLSSTNFITTEQDDLQIVTNSVLFIDCFNSFINLESINSSSVELSTNQPQTKLMTPESANSSTPEVMKNTSSTDVTTALENPMSENNKENLNQPTDCADFVIGSTLNGVVRIRDYFASSRLGPQLDLFYGGKDSLTAATIQQKDGVTTMIFRKPLQADDNADIPIVEGPMTLLWAKGDILGAEGKDHTFFKEEDNKNGSIYLGDLIKYDGKKNGGIVTVDFFAEQKSKPIEKSKLCTGSFAYPTDCKGADCNYFVSWSSDGRKVDFVLESALKHEQWTGIAYSLDGSMAKSDIVGVSLPKDSEVRVLDYYSPGYGRPKLDEDQGVFDIHASYVSGRVYANFSRSLASTDEQDISLEQCVYFIFPVSGGPIEEGFYFKLFQFTLELTTLGSGDIKKHYDSPISSRNKICLKNCEHEKPVKKILIDDAAAESPIRKASIIPTEILDQSKAVYDVTLRVLNKKWDSAFLNHSSTEFQEMSDDISSVVNSIVNTKWPNLKVVRISDFEDGNLAHLLLATDDDVAPTATSLKSVLEEYAMRGPVESLNIEPTTIKVVKREPESKSTVTPIQLRNWILIAIGVLLTLIATCFICCIFHRSRKSKKTLKYSPYPVPCAMAGYDYEATMVPPIEKKGFENAAFQTTLHARQFSQATTVSQNGKNSPNSTHESPKGVGETTYQEWFTKVASKPASQHHQESTMPSPGRPSPSRQSYGSSPYVSYPNDPINFYTLNGEHRITPSRYIRPY